jgi:hypothetical protein
MQTKVVTFALAGGRGNRLLPLTKERAKCSEDGTADAIFQSLNQLDVPDNSPCGNFWRGSHLPYGCTHMIEFHSACML